MLVSLCMQANLMEHEDYRSREKFNLRDFEKTAEAEKFYPKIVLLEVMQPGWFFKVIVVILAAVSLSKGVILQCSFVSYVWYEIGTQYTCFRPVFTNDGNLTHVLNVTGTHLSGKSNADVRGFLVESAPLYLNRLPRGLEIFFGDLLAFQWPNGNLTTLTADDLEPFPNLKIFRAHENKLTSLDGDLFKHTPSLEDVIFYSNLLDNVGFGLIDSLNNLTRAWFSNNSCINMDAATPAAISELKLQLQNQCPPLATTTTAMTSSTSFAPTTTIGTSTEPEQCSIECVEIIKTLEERQIAEITVLREKIARQDEKIAAQADEMVEQNNKIAAQGDAIEELEKQMKEIWARP